MRLEPYKFASAVTHNRDTVKAWQRKHLFHTIMFVQMQQPGYMHAVHY